MSKTAMMSAFLTVESLCAIITVVLPLDILSMDLFKAASVSLSTLLVASSRISIGASFRTALAMAILCLWPPDRRCPPSPISVCQPFGRISMNSVASAILAASLADSTEASGLPYLMLSRTEPGNNVVF